MRALVWIAADTWEATVDEAAAFLPADAEVTLLHVTAAEADEIAAGARYGLLGRRPPPPPAPDIPEEAARELRAEARARLGRDAALVSRRGRVEREVVAAAGDADLLILARGGDPARLGPHSLGPHERFVIDHAPTRVLVVWPAPPPRADTIPHAPPKPPPKPAKPKPPPA
jgi:hypothetical protein